VKIQKFNEKIDAREREAKLQLELKNSKLKKLNNKKTSFFINKNINSNYNKDFEDVNQIKTTPFKKSRLTIIDDDEDDEDIFEDTGGKSTGNSNSNSTGNYIGGICTSSSVRSNSRTRGRIG
jgi:hypothetical protein